MAVLKKLFNFYLNSSIHVAIAATSLTAITMLKLDLTWGNYLLFFVFFSAITGYNFVKFFCAVKFHKTQLKGNLKVIQAVSFFSFGLMFYFATHLQLKTLICIACLGVLTVLYAVPFLPKYKNSSLRNIRGIKVYIIALVWTGVSVVLPVVNTGYEVNENLFLLLIQHFSYVIVLMLPFEIRDLKFDSQKLATIPQKIGIVKTKILGLLLLVFCFFIEFLKIETNNTQIITFLPVLIVTGLFVWFSKKEQNKYYCSFYIEGLPVLWLIFLLIFKFSY